MPRLTEQQKIGMTILVGALGYFVDIFDIQLFSIVRVGSLKSLGLSPDAITSSGIMLLNWQMVGMLLGGILWGMLGDKKGRVYVLFGTILLYSLGNIANAFVTTIPAYAAARFFSGLGLAGEIGTSITLVSELLPKSTRSYGASIVAGCGVMGPIAAGYVADALDWRTAYIVGGILGFLLLFLRIFVVESHMFNTLEQEMRIARGRFRMLLNNRKRFIRYALCIISATPVYFVFGILTIFAPELGTALGADVPLKASTAVISYFVGATLGNFLTGLLSQIFRSRKKVMGVFILGAAAASVWILFVPGLSAAGFYGLVGLGGFFTGYWTLFLTTTAEQFGTNLRATATSSAANFVRASVIIDTFLITILKPSFGYLGGVQIVMALCFAVGLLALWKLPETFGRDLDFVER